MQKTTLYTSALVAAGFLVATPASAAEKIKLQLGGAMEQWAGYTTQDDSWEKANSVSYGHFDVKGDSEIFVSGSTKLDNGLVVSATVELEADKQTANTDGSSIDQAFLSVESPTYGSVSLGEVQDAVNGLMVKAPEMGIENNDGDYGLWVVAPTGFQDITLSVVDLGKNAKINYTSPSFAGFQVAATYVPETADSALGAQPDLQTIDQAWGYGVSYNASYDGVVVAAAIGRSVTDNNSNSLEDLKVTSYGLKVSTAGFTVGGSYGVYDQGTPAGMVNTASTDGRAWDLGVAYETGPYGVSLSYFKSQAEDDVAVAGDSTKTSWMLSGAYAMGPGVTLKGSIVTVDYDNELSGVANNNKGWAAVSGLVLDF